MKDAIIHLISSKRAIVAVLTAIANMLVLSGVMPTAEEYVQPLVIVITTLGSVLIGAYTATDRAAQANMPVGVDHKGRVLADVEHEPFLD